jgi:hypothetical protein
MTVSGFITDAETGEPVSSAGVTLGPRYTHVDMAGHYRIKVHRHIKDKLQVVAKGYEPAAVAVDSEKTRLPQVNVALNPAAKRAAVHIAEPSNRAAAPATAPATHAVVPAKKAAAPTRQGAPNPLPDGSK